MNFCLFPPQSFWNQSSDKFREQTPQKKSNSERHRYCIRRSERYRCSVPAVISIFTLIDDEKLNLFLSAGSKLFYMSKLFSSCTS